MIEIDKFKFQNNEILKSEWDFSNSILYDLCRNYPEHKKVEIIITKILFIGRIYAAAIERRKNKIENINDDFYIDIVAPKLKNSNLDMLLNKIHNNSTIIEKLKLHKYLTDIFNELTDLNKRSLSSKYLHFHKPNIFYIYDSRVNDALREFRMDNKEINKIFNEIKKENIDKEYAKFYLKMEILKNKIEKENNIELTLRNLDTLMINIGNVKLQNKKGYK